MKKRWIVVGVLAAGGIFGGMHMHHGQADPPRVQTEVVGRHDLTSLVTATGQLEPHTKVDVIADVTGRVEKIAVKEGQLVSRGQFLLQIDPAEAQAEVDRASAQVATAKSSQTQAQTNLDLATREFKRTADLQKENPTLVAEDDVDKLRTQMVLDSSLLTSAVHAVDEATASLRQSQSALAKATLLAPVSGKVTRLNVAEGDMAITGTYSRDAATLLTISDMSTLETKVMVPEADVSRLDVGDSANVTLDAFPDSSFPGRVDDISSSSASNGSNSNNSSGGMFGSGGGARVVNYQVTVRLLRVPARIRPDFSATAAIVTAVRHQATAVPLIALTVRDEPPLPGQMKPRDVEGVYILGARDSVRFRPVTVGITGERYVEILSGVNLGEHIVSGPYEVVRTLKDGMVVRH